MENQNQDITFGYAAQRPPGAAQPEQTGTGPPRQRGLGTKRTILIAAVLILLAIGALIVFSLRPAGQSSQSVNSNFNAVDIPLSDFAGAGGTNLLGTRSLTVNGNLIANSGFQISPSAQPSNTTAGQIYYDKATNQLAYYNGARFVPLTDQVQVGAGLSNTAGVLANTGVLSVQGQTGAVTLAAGPGITINGTTISNSGVNSLVSGSPTLTVTDDGGGNLTITNSGAGSGTVQSPGGTAGRIAKFTGVQTIADSLLSESGGTVTVNGNLDVTGSLTLGTMLSVSNGGTGASTLTNNGVLVGQGSGAITAISAAGPGLCLQSTAGAPAFSACPGSGGVTSLNGLTGALSIANASGAGATVTINDASTAQKGIAQFNATNFSAASGTINTIQNINTAASPTFTNMTLQGGGITLGTAAQAGSLIVSDGSSNTGTLQVAALGQNTVYTLPDPAGASATICLNTGNCAGAGSGVTTAGGTANRIAKFTAGQVIGDSSLTDNGSTVSTTGNVVVQGGSLTVGVAGSQLGSMVLAHSNGQTTTLQAGASASNLTFILPIGGGNQFQCLKKDTGNQLIWDNCDGGGGGVTATLQNVYNNSNPATFTLNSTNGGLTIRDNATPIGGNLVAVQNSTGATTYLGVTTSAVTLGTNVDMLLQGATAYFSNPHGQTASESFGLNAGVGGTDSVSVGNTASSASDSVAIGSNAASNNDSVSVGSHAVANSSRDVAIGAFSFANGGTATAIGTNADSSFVASVALGYCALTTASNQFVVGGDDINCGGAGGGGSVTQMVVGNGVTNATPLGATLQGTSGSGTNVGGANLSIAAGQGTGTALGGSILFRSSGAGASGASLNSLTTLATLSTTSLTMASGLDVFLQGAGAYFSNPQGQTAAESFGLNATVGASNTLAVGNGATASGGGTTVLGTSATATGDEGVAVGHSANASGAFGGAVAIGNGANAASWGVAIGSSSATSGNFGTAVGQGSSTTGQLAVALGAGASAAQQSVALGADAATAGNNQIAIGFNAHTTGDNQLVIGGSSASGSSINYAIIGSGVTDSAPVSMTLQGTSGSGTNVQGASLTFSTGQGTGSATGGSIKFRVAPAGVAGSSLNPLTTVLTLQAADGSALFQNVADSTAGFAIQTSLGNNLFVADTLNARVGIGAAATPTLSNGATGLNVTGAFRLGGTSNIFDSYTTPGGSAIDTRLSVVNSDLTAFRQVLALGVTSTSATTARGILVADGRTVTHQPSIAVLTPDENNIGGFSWDGSNSAFSVKNTNGSGAINIDVGGKILGNFDGVSGTTIGSTATNLPVAIDTGTGTISIGVGAQNRTVNVGTGAADQLVTVGSLSGSSALTLKSAAGGTLLSGGAITLQKTSDSTSAVRILNSTNGEVFGADTTNSIIRLLNNNPGGLPSWTTNSNNLASGRFEHATVTANGYVYVIAGDDNSDVPQSTVYYAKINANGSIGAWASTTALPSARTELSAVTANGYVYAIGGRNTSQTVQTTVYYAKLNADGTIGTWNTTTALPVEKTNHTSFSANGYIYALGGDTSGGTVTTNYYARVNGDGTIGAWNTTTALTTARRQSASAYANGYIYQIAGDLGGASTNVSYAKVNTDGTIGSWATTTALPSTRINGTAGVLNGYLYHLGGDNVVGYDTTYYAPLNSDGTIGSWTQSTNMNTTRRSPSSIAVNGYIYAIGGENGSALTSQEYASPGRVSIGGSLDLLGVGGENLPEGSSGGQLTAGDTFVSGQLNVTGQSSFKDAVTVLNNLTLNAVNDSTAAFTIINSSAVPQFSIDTSNSRVYIGNPTADATGALLVLDTKNTSGDPSGVNGSMYYNSALHEYRCYRGVNATAGDGAWEPCGVNPIDRGYVVEDDFMGGTASTDGAIGNAGWTRNAITSNATIFMNSASKGLLPSADHPGVFDMETPASANNGTTLTLANSSGLGAVVLAAGQVVKTTVSVGSSASTSQTLRVGLHNETTSTTAPTTGVFWEADPTNNANWMYCYNNTGTPTCASSGVAIAADTWVRLEIRITALGSGTSAATFIINGTTFTVSSATINTTNAVNPAATLFTQAGTARHMDMDYFQFRGTASAAR